MRRSRDLVIFVPTITTTTTTDIQTDYFTPAAHVRGVKTKKKQLTGAQATAEPVTEGNGGTQELVGACGAIE